MWFKILVRGFKRFLLKLFGEEGGFHGFETELKGGGGTLFVLFYSGVRLMGSWFMGSFGYWNQFFWDIRGLFGLSTVSQQKCVSVNGGFRLMESVWLGPKAIPLSGAHYIFIGFNELWTSPLCLMLYGIPYNNINRFMWQIGQRPIFSTIEAA